MGKVNHWKRMYALCLFFFSAAVFSQDQNETDSRLSQYEANRAQHQSESQALESKHMEDIAALQAELDEANQSLAQTRKKISDLKDTISLSELKGRGFKATISGLMVALVPEIAFLTPFGALVSFSETLKAIVVICIIWLIVLAISKFIGQGRSKRPYEFFLLVIALISLFFVSRGINAQELDLTEKLQAEFVETNKLLRLTDHERYIRVLESGKKEVTQLPDLASGNEHLIVYRTVQRKSGEYFMTLAALNSHLGRAGEAVENIKKINYGRTDDNNKDTILTRAIKFLIENNQMEAASDLFGSKVNSIVDTNGLISLADFLKEKGLAESSDRALARAVQIAESPADLIRLSDFLYENDKTDQGEKSLQLAFSRSSEPNELANVVRKLAQRSSLPTADVLFERFERLIVDYNQQAKKKDRQPVSGVNEGLSILDILSQRGFQEKSIEFFSALMRSQELVGVSTANLKTLLNYAMQKGWFEQASNVVPSIVRVVTSERRFTYKLRPSKRLPSEQGLPEQEELSLPVLAGLLYEEQGFHDKAKETYSHSVLNTLASLQLTFGSEVVADINSFYLLGRQFIREESYAALEELDQTYSLVEDANLEARRVEMNVQIIDLRARIDQSRISGESDRAKLKALELRHQNKLATLSKLKASMAGLIVLVLLVLIAAAMRAWHYAKEESELKTFAGINKFVEQLGWLKIHSLVGVLSGFILVFFGQGLQVFKRQLEVMKTEGNRRAPEDGRDTILEQE